jgi:hypothetical protein
MPIADYFQFATLGISVKSSTDQAKSGRPSPSGD